MSPDPSPSYARAPRPRGRMVSLALGSAALLAAGIAWSGAAPAYAADAVGLGTADSFAVLAGSEVTNTGPSVISGDLGVSPGSSVSGFGPGVVINGTQHVNDGVAAQAQVDLTAAYLEAAGAPTDTDLTGTDLGGLTLTPGVYEDTSTMQLTGTVTLDAQNDPDAVFIFKAGSSLTTASSSTVALMNGASPCNVFWQVTSTAILGSDTDFVGTVLALTSATLDTGADVEGRILARNAEVTLDTNDITAPDCAAAPPSSSSPPSSSTPPSETASGSPTESPTGPGDGTGGGTPAGPVVPVGNPDTGLDPASDDHGQVLLLTLGLLAAAGALLALSQARRPRRTH